MHTTPARRFHRHLQAAINPRPLTLTEGAPFKHRGKQVNEGVTMTAEIQTPAAPHEGNGTATGTTDATTFPPQQPPSARLEHEQAEVLTHTPWAGWYYETEPG